MMLQKTSTHQYLKEYIAQHGAMSFGDFFALVVSDPKYGYYAQQNPFGKEGDFITAPEISQMFGEMIGAWVYDTWQKMGSPSSLRLIEFGPGRGTLMKDILRVTMLDTAFADAIKVTLIESSPALQKVQHNALSKYNVEWFTELSDITPEAPVIMVGNEFLDALPIEQLKRDAQGWQKRVVQYDDANDVFIFDWHSAEQSLIDLLPQVTESHQIYEVSPQRQSFMDTVCKHIERTGGASLWIDYGYIKRHYGDTLQAVKNHEYCDVLTDVGQNDLTAHVDFDVLKSAAHAYETLSASCTTQGAFLKSLGIEYRAHALQNTALRTYGVEQGAQRAASIAQDLNRLISVSEMGELFKVLTLHDKSIKASRF